VAKIYQFGSFRVEHRTADAPSAASARCEHLSLILDEHGQTVTCGVCKAELTPWWALLALVRRYDEATQKLLALRPRPKAPDQQALPTPIVKRSPPAPKR
jgi:hypothetical protein